MPDREYISTNFYEGMAFHLQKTSPYVIVVSKVDHINERICILWQRGISTQLEADMEIAWHEGNRYSFEKWREWVCRERYSVTLLEKEEPEWEV